MFKDLNGQMVEFYMDDMIIKSRRLQDHARDMVKTFNVLDGIKLNFIKCTLGIKARKQNPKKIQKIMDMHLQKSIKEV